MTIREKVKQAIHNWNGEEDSINKLVTIAYYMGREAATKQTSDKYNDLLAEQRKRAEQCRYYNMAMNIIGSKKYIYTPDYAQDMTTTFGDDETTL